MVKMSKTLLTVICLYGSMTLMAAEIGCDRFTITINPDGTVGRVLSSRGEVVSVNETENKEEPGKKKGKKSTRKSAFGIELQESVYTLEEGKRRTVALNSAVKQGDKLIFSNSDNQVRVTFVVRNKRDYITLQLVKVETPKGEHGTNLEISDIPGLRMFPLDAEVLRGRGKMTFASLLKRSERTKLGSVAIWYPENEEIDDEILYKVWVDEKLPHPKIEGEWTVEQAKKWNEANMKKRWSKPWSRRRNPSNWTYPLPKKK